MTVRPLFNVAAQVIVASIPPFNVNALDAEGALIEWSVSKQWGPSPDMASIAIYNLDPVLRKALSISVSNFLAVPVTLNVGWDGLIQTLFTGSIWKLVAERIETTDVVTMIEAGDGSVALRDSPPSGEAFFGLSMKVAISKILGFELKIPPLPTSLAIIEAEAAKVPVSFFFQDVSDLDPRDKLDILLSTIGLSWGISGGFFVVYKDGKRDDIPPLVLNPGSGLIRWEELDDGGVQLEALGQTSVEPGMQINVIDEKLAIVGGGPLRVEKVDFSGSSEAGFTMAITARKLQILG